MRAGQRPALTLFYGDILAGPDPDQALGTS